VLDKVWSSILDFTSKLVIPDWGALVSLIPVGLLVIVVLWLLRTTFRFATAGPQRRGKRRVTPIAPAGIHMPGPSYAPVLAAIGLFLLFYGLVFGGIALPAGVVALVLTLLYWGREGLRDFDRATDVAPMPARVIGPPPPGIHLPGPSFRPILASLALATLFYGLVFGGWLLAVGVIFLIVALLGWLRDARAEYVKVVDADDTGHLENIATPRWPRRLLTIFAALFVFAIILNLGILPPKSSTATAGGATASGGPAGSGGPGGSAATGSGGPGASGGGGAGGGDVSIVAEGVKFTTTDVSAPAGKDFTIAFDNKDTGTPHDVDILAADGSKVFNGDPVTGPKQQIYQVKSLPAGTYKFECSIHPSLMTGTITAK
jgi:plastocyanin